MDKDTKGRGVGRNWGISGKMLEIGKNTKGRGMGGWSLGPMGEEDRGALEKVRFVL